MSGRLNREAYARLVAEDIEWLLKQPRTLEREHIEEVLKRAVFYEYGPDEREKCPTCDKPGDANPLCSNEFHHAFYPPLTTEQIEAALEEGRRQRALAEIAIWQKGGGRY